MSKELEVFKKISKSHEIMAYHFNPHLDKWDENYMICINENWEEELDIIKKALTKLDKIENVIHDWVAGKYGFSHEANALHIKDIQNIIKEEENE